MKEQMIKWMSVMVLISFAAAVFMISDGYYWPGIAFMGAGAGFLSAAESDRKKNEADHKDQKRS